MGVWGVRNRRELGPYRGLGLRCECVPIVPNCAILGVSPPPCPVRPLYQADILTTTRVYEVFGDTYGTQIMRAPSASAPLARGDMLEPVGRSTPNVACAVWS
jgi:hypothetical protein